MDVVLTSRYGPGCPGGIEAIVERLAVALAARRPDWTVRRAYAFARVTALSRVPLLTDVISALRLAIRARGADVVVVNGGEYAWTFLLNRHRTVVVWHGTRFGEIPALRPRLSPALRVYAFAEWLLCRAATALPYQIAVGESVVEELRVGYGYRGPVTVIENGIDAASAAKHAVSGPVRLLWSGTAPHKKGLDLALAACERAIGDGVALTLTVAGLHVRGASPAWLRALGPVAPDAVPGLLAATDVYLATSRYEGCSIACLEAMAMGVPVVGTPIMQWMVAGGGRCAQDYTAPAIAAAIGELTHDRAVLELAGVEAMRIARTRFAWPQCVGRYERLIVDVAATASAEGPR